MLLCTTRVHTHKKTPCKIQLHFKSAHFAGPLLDDVEMPTRSFDVLSESLQPDAVINPKGTAGGRRVPLISTRTADEVYCIRKHSGFFLPPNVTVTIELQSGARLARELRARATVTQTAFWKKAVVLRLSARVKLNSAVGVLAVQKTGFLLLHFNSDLRSGAFKSRDLNTEQRVALCYTVQRTHTRRKNSRENSDIYEYILVSEFPFV